MQEELFLNSDDAMRILEELHSDEVQTFLKAQKEYAQSENIFANFVRQGERLKLSPEKVLMVFAIKHFDGIVAHVNGYETQREKIDGRIQDLRIYLSLLEMMVIKRRSDNEQQPGL